jgi:hypothetical protein
MAGPSNRIIVGAGVRRRGRSAGHRIFVRGIGVDPALGLDLYDSTGEGYLQFDYAAARSLDARNPLC